MVADHGVVLSTLKDFFQFLGWLNSNDDETVLEKVASELENRIDTCHKNPQFESEFRSSLIKFLDGISLVYHQISKEPSARTYDQKTAAQVAEAFHECLIKVHSALIYLLDIVSLSYDDACGGDRERFEELQDHELKEYLIFSNSDDFNGIITGGFGDGDLKNLRASKLAENIQNALGNLERLNDILGCNKRIKEDYKESDLPPANVPDIPIKPSSKVVPTKTGNAKPVIKSDGKHIRCDKNELAQSHGKMSEDAQNQRWDGSTFPYQDDDLFAVTDSDLPHYNQYLSGSPDGWHQAAVHSVDPEKLEAEKKVPVVPAKKHIPEDQPPKEKPPKVNEQPKDLASPPETLMPKEKSTSKIASAKRVATKSQATKNETSHPFKKSEEARDQGKYSDPDWDKLFDRIEQEDAYSYAGCAYESPQEPDGPGYPSPKVPAASPKVVPEKNVSTTPSKKPELTPVLFSGRPKKPEVPPAKVPVTKPTATKTEAVKPVLTKAKAAKPTATSTPLAQNPGKKSERGQDQSNEAESYRNQHDFEESDTYYASEDPNVHTLTDEQTEESEGSPNLGKEVDALLDDYDVSIHEMTSDSPVPYSDVDLQEHADSGPQRSSLAEALGIPKEPVPQKHPPKVPPKNSDSPPLEASREYVPEKQSEGPQYQVEALDVDTDLNNGQGDLMPAYSPVDYTHFPQLPGNQGDQPNQGQQGDQPQQIQRNPELQNTTPALAAETGKNPAAVRLQPTTYYSGKKLTDCPTNLRESIDWIIQLKYGSGHGDGVDNLSEALDKLHRKLIADSFSNLLDQLSDLLDPWKTTPCCRRIHRAIRTIKIKLQHPRNIQRNHINGLLKQLEYNKEVCLQHHYIDSSKDEALKDVHSKMRDLAGVSRDINTSRNGLLHHLCDGVQILLGFDSSSKGYSGSGIVYSELDRLCDGVMAFLSGVLKYVHENENLHPYGSKLTSTVRKLHDHLNKGGGAWRDAIDIARVEFDKSWKVTGGIGGWLGEVERTHEAVKKLLKELMEKDTKVSGSVDIPGLLGDIRNVINGTKNAEVSKNGGFLSRWVGNLDKITKRSKESPDKLNELDARLMEALSPHVTLINEAVESFVESTKRDHEGLVKVWEKVKVELTQLETSVKEKAEQAGEACREELQQAFKTKIKHPIGEARSTLEAVKKSLQSWSEEALQDATAGLENAKQILDEVAEKSKNRERVDNAVTQLRDAAEHYYVKVKQKELEALCHQARYTLENLCIEVTELVDEYYGFLEQYCLSILSGQGFNVYGNGQNVSSCVQLLHTVSQVVQGYAGIAVSSASQFEQTVQDFRSLLYTLQNQHLQAAITPQIFQSLTTFVNNIKTAVQGYVGHLRDDISNLHSLGSNHFVVTSRKTNGAVGNLISVLSIATEFAHLLYQALQQSAWQSRQQPTNLRGLQNVQDELQEILRNVNCYSGDVSQIKSHIVRFERDITKPFEQLMGSISAACETVNQKLEDLKNMITRNGKDVDVEHDLEKIKEEIDKIIGTSAPSAATETSNTLTQIITAAETFQNETIPNTVKTYIEQIRSTVKSQTVAKIEVIQKSAVTEFANSKAEELKQLEELVKKEKERISDIIKRDFDSGIKGLMKWMYGGRYPYGEDPKREHPLIMLAEALPKRGGDAPNGKEYLQRIKGLSSTFQTFLNPILEYVQKEVTKVLPAKPQSGDAIKEARKEPNQLRKIKDDLDVLLQHFSKTHKIFIFDFHFSKLLSALTSSLSALSPNKFANPRHPELLDAVKKGLSAFTDELMKGYVNRYDGHPDELIWEADKSNDSEKCAKICVTIMEMMKKNLSDLKRECNNGGKWHQKCICLFDLDATKKKTGNPLGEWLTNRGFTVPSENDKQDGELRNRKDFTGAKIYTELLDAQIKEASKISAVTQWKKEIKEKAAEKDAPKPVSRGSIAVSIQAPDIEININLLDIVLFLLDRFRTYYRVGHYYIPAKPKAPSNVYYMLCWLAGLRWNHMYDELGEYFKELYDKPEGQEDKPYKEFSDTDLSVDANSPLNPVGTSAITPKTLTETLEQVSLLSRTVSVAILGHGHAEGVYASDFSCNSDKLLYPSNLSSCLDMLVDVINRVYYQLRFLFIQCQNGDKLGGWEDCWYGRHVGGSSWKCNEFQCPNLECNLSANQSAKQIGNQNTKQTCDQHPKCGIKSPLQSFLEDGLPGFLPHTFKTPGCKLTCSVSNHFGKPCLTPMGFADISVTASHTKTGYHLKEALNHLCGNAGKPLSKLCSFLRCVLRMPPQTLGGMFAFYYCFLKNWNDKGVKHKKDAFEEAVRKAYFGQTYLLNPTILLDNAVYKQHATFNHATADMSSLTDCDPKSGSGLPCGKYLHPITLSIFTTFSSKRAGNYLSWVVYTTETFFGLLYDLYESCKKCSVPGTRCCDKSCTKGCRVKSAYSSDGTAKQLNGLTHTTDCHSIVKCPDMHPTLHKYGFIFGSPYKLNGAKHHEAQKRTCKDFCTALENVIREKNVLHTFAHETIPKFLWAIRLPFFYTMVALWSIAALLIVYTLLCRLEILRIRSHLIRFKVSHLINVKALLTPRRKMLSLYKDVDYFDDDPLEVLYVR
ncbi:hypothetical protein, conserved [Babesia ovata]|uniref:Uncharacterized protein n=1 Tax=Babesia ovata TaxID=189622 RepID=A0A2H6KG83_9APIC|nr:uncharacterized protein BOVATA_035030 [Babesia ovata]GBE62010.1 hypothetical protein, conserved [Babesia ovata]